MLKHMTSTYRYRIFFWRFIWKKDLTNINLPSPDSDKINPVGLSSTQRNGKSEEIFHPFPNIIILLSFFKPFNIMKIIFSDSGEQERDQEIASGLIKFLCWSCEIILVNLAHKSFIAVSSMLVICSSNIINNNKNNNQSALSE